MIRSTAVMLRPALICVLLLAATRATAAPGRAPRPPGVGVRLDYERGSGARQCPSAEALTDEVRAELGAERFTRTGPWRLHTTINREGNGRFVATADIFDSTGVMAETMEKLFSTDCSTLVKQVAVWTAGKLTDPPPPPPLVAPAPIAGPAPVVAPPGSPHGAVPWQVRLGLGTALGFGVAPRATVGVTSHIEVYRPVALLAFDAVSFMYSMRFDPPATGTILSRNKTFQVRTERAVISLDPCVHRGWFFACAMFGVGNFDNRSGDDALRAGKFANEDARLAVQDISSLSIIFVSGGRLGFEGPSLKGPFLTRFGFRVSGELVGNVTPITIPLDERAGWTTPDVVGGVEVGLYIFEERP